MNTQTSKRHEWQAFSKKLSLSIPLYQSKIPAGFPSPAADYIEKTLDYNEHLVKHPAATFSVRVSGHSMIGAGIHDGDLLVVDRAITPKHNCVVIAVLDGELTVKRLNKKANKVFLMAENPDFKPIEISAESSFEIWGVVTNVIHSLA
jgi:DNA polymerase V